MDFKQIEAFVNVIKYKGFSKAAEATFLTQPTISAHVNAIEKELNLQLIDRTRKEAIPTAEGKIFYNYAISMLNTREQAIFSLQNFALNINGKVDVQSSSIPGEYILPTLMAEFLRDYPNAKFDLTQSDSATVINNIKIHKGEIGFTGRKADDGLTYKLLANDRSVIITPDNECYRAKSGETLKLENLLEETFVLRAKGSATEENFEQALENCGISVESLNVAARMNSMEAIKQAVKNGMGISVISEAAAERDHEGRGYLVFDIEEDIFERSFYMAYDERITMSPTAETFKYFVLEKYGYKFD